MVDKRLFRVIVLGGIALAPAAALTQGCTDDDTAAPAGGDASPDGVAQSDGFPSEGPMQIDSSTLDVVTDTGSADARDAADADANAADAPDG
jgi:hypothetical protein